MKKLKEIGLKSFSPGDDASSLGTFKSPIGKMSPHTGADSWFSQYSQAPPNYVPEDEEDDEDIILECRVYRSGKYCLVETLNNVKEYKDYADEYRHMANKLNRGTQERMSRLSSLDSVYDRIDEEDDLDEMSAGGVVGVAVPMGYTSKGRPETPSQRKKRQKFNREKSFPYK